MQSVRVLAMNTVCFALGCSAAAIAPQPAPGFPDRMLPAADAGAFAHVFAASLPLSVRVPEAAVGKAATYRVADRTGQIVTAGPLPRDAAELALASLPIGWYRTTFHGEAGEELAWTPIAVLAPRRVPARPDSPVCTDSATAWFARGNPEKQNRFAVLAALAGVNWIRDRLTWNDLQPARERIAEATDYDTSAEAHARHGLAGLQVMHSTAHWALDRPLDGEEAWKRFPRDLRDIHRFCQAMAARFRGRVQAWEPWNEANIDGFGGHTADEMCALQKAAYLGLKAGNPEIVAGWNVYAGSPNALHAELILGNVTWPYYDTFNIHSYSPPEAYPHEFRHSREVACGRPIWISECGIRLRFVTPRPWGDLTPEDDWRQACFLPKSYATSLFAGVDRHFFFILGNYCEGDIQFGLLRHDQTPRPAYCALAAVGRFLDGARCLGRLPVSANDPF
ncbi:MAG: hypothetical protein JXR77_06070, partial [Lentisphaeria bacterium]|nr:hypothetical protein [Lentisphaeria bacterium]